MDDETRPAKDARARRRADYLANLLWHAGSFAIIGGLLVFFDWSRGGGVGWSIWVVGLWAVALAFHALAYLIDGSNLRDRKTRQFLDQLDETPKSDHKPG